jgi:CHAT domain-containing protein
MRKLILIALLFFASITAHSQSDMMNLMQKYLESVDVYCKTMDMKTALKFSGMAHDLALKYYGPHDTAYTKILHDFIFLQLANSDTLASKELLEIDTSNCRKYYGSSSAFFSNSLNLFAMLEMINGNVNQARNYLRRVAIIDSKVHNYSDSHVYPFWESYAKYQGVLYILKDFPKLDLFQDITLEIFKEEFGDSTWVYAWVNLAKGFYNANLGRIDVAENCYKKALEISKRYSYCDYPYTPIKNLANLYYQLGRRKEADSLNELAFSILLKYNPTNLTAYANCLIYRGQIQLDLGNLVETKQIFQEAMDSLQSKSLFSAYNYKEFGFYNRMICLQWSRLSGLYFLLGDFKKADSLYNLIIERLKKEDNPNPELYKLVLKENVQRNIAFSRYEKINSKVDEVLTHNLSRICAFKDAFTESEIDDFYNLYRDDFNIFYSYAINNYHKDSNLICRIADYRFATKGLLLNSTIDNRRKIFDQLSDGDIIEKFLLWEKIRKQVAEYSSLTFTPEPSVLDSLESECSELEKELIRNSTSFCNYCDRLKSWKEYQIHLEEDEVFVEILRFQHYGLKQNQYNQQVLEPGFLDSTIYMAIIIDKYCSIPKLVIIYNGNDLEGKYYNEYKSVISPSSETINSYSSFKKYQKEYPIRLNNLYKGFWEQIDSITGKYAKLIISADGIYHRINISTLIDNKGDYLLNNQQIYNITSPKELIERGRVDQDLSRTALLYGNPNYDFISRKNKSDTISIRWQQLLSTEIEVNEIDSILKENKWATSKVCGNDAKESHVKSCNNPGILHIATHAYFENENKSNNPLLLSGLVFAGANHSKAKIDLFGASSDDGLLTALEIMNLDLMDTKLVVLSACETFSGVQRDGEGIYGLLRAFKIAGTSKILLTFWKIEDEFATDFMVKFYSNLMVTFDANMALRKTQLFFINTPKYSNPHFWGSFVLVGL